ncbi:hypothetical protein [Thiofilum flexile]|uniref:hypothetical protein n=1 Tax=Thiofilum flexile TaxID=125627 RepID=UPI000373F20F|nr:hypothetical protein [Thiofilum flexile]
MLFLVDFLKKYMHLFFLNILLISFCGIVQAQQTKVLSSYGYLFSSHVSTEPNSISGEVILYRDLVNFTDEIKMIKLPTIVKKDLFYPTTYNPFKVAYSYLYTSNNLGKLKSCPFVGIPFELDNNPKTQEWFIATSLYGCLNGQASGNGVDAHLWILQKDSQNKSRVLMESDGTLSITKTPQDKGGYRQIRTEHYVTRFAPQDKLGCGRVLLKWGYNGKQYKILEQGATVSVDCDGDRYDENLSKAENAQRKRQTATQVKAVVDRWLPTLKAFR